MTISNLKSQRLASSIAIVMLAIVFMWVPKGASAGVEFGTFTVNMGNNSIMCYWQALSQTNNASFTVEKSWTSGTRSASMSWTPVTSMQGAGNSHSALSYYYIDNTPGMVGNQQVTGGYLLYRIRQTDFDGHTTATAARAIRWGSLNESSDNVITSAGDEDVRTSYINYFMAKAKNTNVICSWQSQPGADNSVYSVQRSTNGITYTTFATISGDGVTTNIQKYSVTDYNVTASVVWYRLAQFDAGVGTTYSPARKVILSTGGGGRPEETSSLSAFSSEEGLHINYNAASAGTVNLVVSDYLGKIITNKNLSAAEGRNTYTVNDAGLHAGIYHVTVVKDGDVSTQSIVKN